MCMPQSALHEGSSPGEGKAPPLGSAAFEAPLPASARTRPAPAASVLCCNAPETPEISTLSLHDALPISLLAVALLGEFIVPAGAPGRGLPPDAVLDPQRSVVVAQLDHVHAAERAALAGGRA